MQRSVSHRRLAASLATTGVQNQNVSSPSKQHSEDPQTQDAETTELSGILPAQYIVTKSDEEISAYNGESLQVEFRGTAGEDDGRVLQQTFDAKGGRVFIRRGEYTPDQRLILIGCAGDPTQHVEVNGLVLDGDKPNRTTRTRTADTCEAIDVTLRNCIIFGGEKRRWQRRVRDRRGRRYGFQYYR